MPTTAIYVALIVRRMSSYAIFASRQTKVIKVQDPINGSFVKLETGRWFDILNDKVNNS